MIIHLTVTILITIALYFPGNFQTIKALEPSTPSADIKLKLKALQEEIASKAVKLKQEISQKMQNKAYVGFLKNNSDSSLTLATRSGLKIITITEDTIYSKTTNKGKAPKVTLASLSPDNYLVALGDIDEAGVLTAKKIVLLTPPDTQKHIVLGQVTALGSQSFVIKDKDDESTKILVDEDTDYQLGKVKALDSILLGKQLVVVGEGSPSATLKARFVYLPLLKTTPSNATSSAIISSSQPESASEEGKKK